MRDRAARPAYWVPALVALLSLTLTLAVWIGAARAIRERDDLRFKNAVEQARHLIQDRMERQLALLRSTKAMVQLHPDLKRSQFEAYVRTIELRKHYPGLTGLGWSVRIPPDKVSELEDSLRRQGWPDFKVSDLSPEPHAIVYLEPVDERNTRAIGYNMFSHEIRREAMSRARDTGLPGLSGKVRLVQETETDVQPGFLIYLPVYHGNRTPPTVEERRRLLRGFVYSPFRAHDLFQGIFEGQTDPQINLAIYDGPEIREERLLFESKRLAGRKPLFIEKQPLEIAGHRWTVLYRSTPEFERGSGAMLLLWLPALGLIFTGVLTAVSFRQAHFAVEVAARASELERREFQQRLLANAGTLLNASLDVEKTLVSLAELAVPQFADWCAVDMLDETGAVKRLAVAHVDPAKVQLARDLEQRYPANRDAPQGVYQVMRTGKAELYKHIPVEMLRNAARDDEHWQIIQSLQLSSGMIVPLTARGRVLGAMTFVYAESGRHYDEADLDLAEQIASRAAIAVDNALLYREAEHERQQVQKLNAGLEDLVRERTSELETANRELEAFSYSVSHDLRGPLRSVDGFSRSLLEDYGHLLDETAHDYLNRVRAAAKRMDELITALLSLSRITRLELVKQHVDVSRLARDAAEQARSNYGSHVEVRVQDRMYGFADPRMLQLVLDNLLSNAVKFSARSQDPLVEMGKEGDVFFVKDNGVGFNMAYSGKLFAPFERLHSDVRYTGSGIGLATVQRIIHRHGGRIWAEAEEGKGATFYFTLG